mmetsp:Transcript_20871/g.23248  ORF Transcript_20871/g.23248 Transcript_20871/m.23248 type:complete len:261 (-) Transcript_20871:314-1096(-)
MDLQVNKDHQVVNILLTKALLDNALLVNTLHLDNNRIVLQGNKVHQATVLDNALHNKAALLVNILLIKEDLLDNKDLLVNKDHLATVLDNGLHNKEDLLVSIHLQDNTLLDSKVLQGMVQVNALVKHLQGANILHNKDLLANKDLPASKDHQAMVQVNVLLNKADLQVNIRHQDNILQVNKDRLDTAQDNALAKRLQVNILHNKAGHQVNIHLQDKDHQGSTLHNKGDHQDNIHHQDKDHQDIILLNKEDLHHKDQTLPR